MRWTRMFGLRLKRWQLLTLVLVVAILSLAFGSYAWSRHSAQQRETSYQAALRSYSKDMTPGMSRRDVENYLRGKNVAFRQMCCVGKPQKAWADLIKIGEERPPWYCSYHNIYIAFEFAAVEKRDLWDARDSDRLVQVTIFRWLEVCL